jgi:large subunit ribosomal protein L29
MNVSEMKSKTVVELNTELSSLLQEQFNMRMQKGMGQMTNMNELRRVRRDIARVKTIITQKSTGTEKSVGSNAA